MTDTETIALVIYSHRGRTWRNHNDVLSKQRQWARVSIKNHVANPDKLARPMCIVRLKAWK